MILSGENIFYFQTGGEAFAVIAPTTHDRGVLRVERVAVDKVKCLLAVRVAIKAVVFRNLDVIPPDVRDANRGIGRR